MQVCKAQLKDYKKIEQGQTNLNMVLKMFGHELAPLNSKELAG
jgi:hypothetical protein